MTKRNPSIVDESDCDRPACDDIVSMMQQAAAASKATGVVPQRKHNQANPMTTTAAATIAKDASPTDCPLGSIALGRSSWDLLHSMAAWYPERPSDTDQQQMRNFIAALARFYPCTWCAADFQQSIQEEPVATQSRTELCQWLCHQHNRVNDKLGKPLYSCDMKTLDQRWRKSDQAKCQGSSLH